MNYLYYLYILYYLYYFDYYYSCYLIIIIIISVIIIIMIWVSTYIWGVSIYMGVPPFMTRGELPADQSAKMLIGQGPGGVSIH